MSIAKFDQWYASNGQKRNMVLQTVQFVKTTTSSYTGGTGQSWYDTDMNPSITLSSSTNKVLITCSLQLASQYWELQGRFTRNGTVIGVGKRNTSSQQSGFICSHYMGSYTYYTWYPTSYTYLDSPGTTSPLTYLLQLNSYSTNALYINRTHDDTNYADYYGCPISTITLMEIQA